MGLNKNVTGNVAETRKNGNVITDMWRKHDRSFPTRKHNGIGPVHGKLDHHVSAGRKRSRFKQLHVSVEFTKYGNTSYFVLFSEPAEPKEMAVLLQLPLTNVIK